MQQAFRQQWNTLRPVITGWLAMLLLLPALVGLAPQVANAAMEDASYALCAQKDAGGQEHRNHHEDCPCCLASAAGFTALAAPSPGEPPAPLLKTTVLRWHRALQPAALASQMLPPPARGPPAFLSA